MSISRTYRPLYDVAFASTSIRHSAVDKETRKNEPEPTSKEAKEATCSTF
jgi:hypothetical protein